VGSAASRVKQVRPHHHAKEHFAEAIFAYRNKQLNAML
jgi:hypothetical protein